MIARFGDGVFATVMDSYDYHRVCVCRVVVECLLGAGWVLGWELRSPPTVQAAACTDVGLWLDPCRPPTVGT